MTNEQQRQKTIEAAKNLLGKVIIIEAKQDLTPKGARSVKVVKSRRGKKLPQRMIALYVAGRFFRHLEITLENLKLSEEWFKA